MQEKEWGTCTQPDRMLLSLRGQASGRKLRLFACACVRRVGGLLEDERSWVAVEVTERFADRRARRADLASAGRAAQAVSSDYPSPRPSSRRSRACCRPPWPTPSCSAPWPTG